MYYPDVICCWVVPLFIWMLNAGFSFLICSGKWHTRQIHRSNKVFVAKWSDFTKLVFTVRDLSQRGLTCQALNLRSSHFRKLNLIGKFMQMHTLNLDFSTSLTSFREDCFTCMPNLRCLSMCETRVSNLWTTIAALSKLPSLAELRFQNCLCCYDTGPCPVSSGGKANDRTYSVQPQRGPLIEAPSVDGWILGNQNSTAQEAFQEFFLHNNVIMNPEFQNTTEDSSDDSEVDFSTHQQEFGLVELLSNAVDLQSEVNHMVLPIRLVYGVILTGKYYKVVWTGEEMNLFLFLCVCIRSCVEYQELIMIQNFNIIHRMDSCLRWCVKIKWNDFISLQSLTPSLVPPSLNSR